MNKALSMKKLLFLFVFFPLAALAQQITGTVTDGSNGSPLPGANVIIKGTSTGTTSDFDGNYSINAESFPLTLEFSSLGYETIEKEVTSAQAVNVTLQESATSLEEVVITGLASSVKRSNLANAVSTVSAEELVGTTGQTTVDGALYGKLTGVNITSASGAPGGGIAVRLRGISSIRGNNQPLFIVDGVYLNNVEIASGLRGASGANRGNEENSSNRLADIDPNDIETIEVLKGASAAAIYGTRANAGVVIITTKRGKNGKTNFRFGQDLGTTRIANPLGLRPWDAAQVEAAFGAGEVAAYNQAIANGGLIDYEDEIYGETGIISETKLGVDGGNGKSKFYVGTSYRNEEGIIANTGFQRLSVKANLDHKISDVFDFKLSSNFIRSESQRSFTGNENEGGLSYGYTLAFTRPWVNLFPDAQGNYPVNPNYPGNPLFVRDNAFNDDENNRFIQGLNLTTKLYTGDKDRLKIVSNFGLDYIANQTRVYVPETHQAQIGNDNGFIARGNNSFTFFNSQVIAVWDHEANDGDLNFTTQLGTTYLDQSSQSVFGQATQLIPGQTSLGQGAVQEAGLDRPSNKDFGYLGQVEANYKDRLIATVGYRLDKSTLNGDPNKFFGFPKASLAVNLNNFDFWNEDGKINQFKLRAAYGETGSSATFGSIFTVLGQTTIGGNGGSSIGGLRGDPSIVPETSTELEFGLDTRLFDVVNFEATYYIRSVFDLILDRALPSSSGFAFERTNIADLENKGLELSLNVDAVNTENFKWNTGVQYWFNRSEVTRLDVPPFAISGAGFGTGLGTFFAEEGKPITQLVGTVDNVVTQLGDVEPDFQLSWNNQITLLKNLDLSFLFHMKEGAENINLTKLLTDLGGTTPDLNTQAGQDRAASGISAKRFVEDASYIRLREAAVYYRFPKRIVKSIGAVENIKLGLSGRNLFTITDYTGYDPEVSVNGSAGLSTGIDVTPFPSSRQFYFHLNVNF